MKCFLLQDWTEVSASASTSSVTQSEPFWLDLSAYRDIVAYIEWREATNTPSLVLQTAPAKDESLFTTLTTNGLAAGGGLTTNVVLQDAVSVPLARWLRWQLSFGGLQSDATFRIWIAASSPGRRGAAAQRQQ